MVKMGRMTVRIGKPVVFVYILIQLHFCDEKERTASNKDAQTWGTAIDLKQSTMKEPFASFLLLYSR